MGCDQSPQLERALIALQRILDDARRYQEDAHVAVELTICSGGVASATTVVRKIIKK